MTPREGQAPRSLLRCQRPVRTMRTGRPPAAQDRYSGPWNRTTAGNPSTCAIGYPVSYLLTGAPPAPGTVCQQSVTPFS